MSAHVVITAILLVFLLLMTIFLVEMIASLALYADFSHACRVALLRMEMNGGLCETIETDLEQALMEAQFIQILIEGTEYAKYGELIRLQVHVVQPIERQTSLFSRSYGERTFSYDMSTISRMVVK